MINQLGRSTNILYKNSTSPLNDKNKDKTSFKGGKFIGFIQTCEKKPMMNVALIDLITAIIPRTILDCFRNIFAGLETFRREASGLVVNCLIPGFITLGYAKLFNNKIMGGKDKANLSSCWASSDTLNRVVEHYDNVVDSPSYKEGLQIFGGNEKHARVYSVNHQLLSEASGLDGFEHKNFKDILSKNEMSKHAKEMTVAMFEEKNGVLTETLTKGTPKNKINKIFEEITSKTHIAQDVKFGANSKTAFTANLESTLVDSHQVLKGIMKENIAPGATKDYLLRAKKLLKTKSVLGMLTILPLALSMQYINRKITERSSGVKGAPIHEGYAQDGIKQKTSEEVSKEKKGLVGKKILAVSSMLGLALLSMMKLPNMKTLKDIVQFKDKFPTMNQARAISAGTFASRMAVADDNAELNEHWTRDTVTFASMYFLGDYGAKGAATLMEKSKGVELLNKNYKPEDNKGVLKKIKNWVFNTHLKSSDELKGAGEELKFAKKLRANAQLANIGTSLLLLGLIVPVYTMFKTKQADKKEQLKRQQALQNNNMVVLNKLEQPNPFEAINSRKIRTVAK